MEEERSRTRFHVFETALGFAAMSWTERGLSRFVLPAADPETALARIRGRSPCEPASPAGRIGAWIALVRRYAAGEPSDFTAVEVAWGDIDTFRRDVLTAARTLGFGETTTYGELAALAGHPGMAREAGRALGSNPVPLIVPCHRVLAAGNLPGGFSAPGGVTTKLRLLALEGVRLGPPPSPQASFAF